jgi:hypothetical protein
MTEEKKATCQDKRGRTFTIRPLEALDRMRMFKILGPDLSVNQMGLAYATLSWCVTAIDNVPEGAPATYKELEAKIALIGDDGLEAIANAYKDHFGVAEIELDRTNVKN